eukprot:m.18459 g.18459  ORF g.18459 m.18459 type:complete len:1051 (+) comp7370_c1_seq1:476-3628(+)
MIGPLIGPLPEGADTPMLSRTSSTSSNQSLDIEDKEIAKHVFSQTFDAIEYPKGDVLNTESVAVNGTCMHLMIYPTGNKDETQLSAFISLDKDQFSRPIGWEAFLTMEFVLVNQNPANNFKNNTHVRFTEASSSWGFPSFIAIKRAYDPANGFVVDGKLTIEATVTAVSGEALKWGMQSRYSSKKATGCVGLNNQGATCYMNSVLQTLFHTNALRRAVFQMPTTLDDRTKSVALALQRLFYDLQTESEPVSTTALTKSFGWTSADSFMQHDVQEFLRVLMDNIEEKMKETPVAGFVPNLFSGTTESYIRCTEVTFESKREETFYDVQLNVRGLASLEAALEQYITPETLDGDNKYQAGDFGLQVAKHGTIFKRLPPVLHLQLKRFEFSLVHEDYVKINDRFEFPEVLDMTRFVQQPSPDGDVYVLHSVLVHSGGSHGGHYYVFIRPTPDGPWLKFNDDMVTKATPKQAMEANFGSPSAGSYRDYGANAYMLVYIRKSRVVEDQRPVDPDDVPPSLLQRFEEDKEATIKAEQEAREMAKSLHVDIITDEYLKQRSEPDPFQLEGIEKAPGVLSLVIRRDAIVEDLMDEIAKLTGFAPDHQRLLPLGRKKQRLVMRDPLKPDTLISDATGYLRSPRWRIYLEVIDPANAREPDEILFFVKRYDPVTQKLHFVEAVYLDENDDVIQLLEDAPAGSTLLVDSSIEVQEIDNTTKASEFANGTAFVVQPPLEEGQESFEAFVDNTLNQVSLVFKRKVPEGTPPPEPITLKLDNRMLYAKVAEAVGRAIGVDDYNKIQFYEYYSGFDEAGSAVPYTPETTLEMMRTRGAWTFNTLYFEVLPLPVEVAQQQKVRLSVHVLDHVEHAFKLLDLFLDKEKPVEECFPDIIPHLPRPPTRPLRLFYVSYMGEVQFPAAGETLDKFVNRYRNYYIEEVPEDQEGLSLDAENEGRRLGLVIHIAREIYRTHGKPFIFTFLEGEIVTALRQRLADYLGLPLATIAKWRIGYELNRSVHLLDDEAVVTLETLRVGSSLKLYLDHPDPTAKRSRYFTEKAVKIYN